jgi:sigma54-dependent transcription regulator
MGTRNALCTRRPLEWATAQPHQWEAPIRTLSVSLVAVAAIAASLLLTRSREERDINDIAPAGENAPVRLKLDAIREAGF